MGAPSDDLAKLIYQGKLRRDCTTRLPSNALLFFIILSCLESIYSHLLLPNSILFAAATPATSRNVLSASSLRRCILL